MSLLFNTLFYYPEEKESSEKDLGKLQNGLKPLDEQHWLEIYAALRPYLRPFGNSKDSRLHYYHRAFGKAVRTRSGLTLFSYLKYVYKSSCGAYVFVVIK